MTRSTRNNHRSARKTGPLWVALLSACMTSPRPVPPSLENTWPTSMGNERRAGYEDEIVPDSLSIAWDVNAGSGLRAGLLVSDSALFAGTSNRQLLAFGTRDGRKFWDQRLEGEIPGDIVRSGRTLFLSTAEWNGQLHARDMERGRRAWRREIGMNTYGPVLDVSAVYVGNDRGQVIAFAPADGSELWRAQLSGSLAAVLANDGDALLATTTRDSLYRIAKQDGRIIARGALDRTVSAAPALSGDTLVIVQFSGFVRALNSRTLQQLWQVDTGAPLTAAPIITRDGVVHVVNRNGDIWRVTHGAGARVATLGGAVDNSFSLTRNRYIVGKVDGTLQVTDLAGHVVVEKRFHDSVGGPVAVRAGALYVPLRHGEIVKLR